MKKVNWKRLAYDLFIDIFAGILIGIGVYNFAANSGFPLAGVSGIALIFYRLFGLPIGLGSVLLNIPIILGCYKTLGKDFFLRSMRSLLISSLLTDYIAPLFPVYSGERMLSAICTGIISGLGYALIFMNNSSTAGMDFVSVAIRTKKPHLSLGKIVFILDCAIVLLGGLVFKDVDATIYGLIISYLLTYVIDKIMYGIDAGKMTFIITENGQAVVDVIDHYIERGATKNEKEIVMCACNNKQMYIIKKLIKEVDEKAFIVIMESNEVVGEGFKEE